MCVIRGRGFPGTQTDESHEFPITLHWEIDRWHQPEPHSWAGLSSSEGKRWVSCEGSQTERTELCCAIFQSNLIRRTAKHFDKIYTCGYTKVSASEEKRWEERNKMKQDEMRWNRNNEKHHKNSGKAQLRPPWQPRLGWPLCWTNESLAKRPSSFLCVYLDLSHCQSLKCYSYIVSFIMIYNIIDISSGQKIWFGK